MIVFITPFPDLGVKSDGYWSRVKTVDKIFENSQRIYLDIVSESNFQNDLLDFEEITQGLKTIIKINWNSGNGRTKLDDILLQAKVIYAHSIYQALYILPFMALKKVIIDFHGVVPEENWIYQDKSLYKEMNEIEKYVYKHCFAVVAVTDKMITHFRKKYIEEQLNKTFIKLPIIQKQENIKDFNLKEITKEKDNNLFIYSGGAQSWQNLNLIYNFVEQEKTFKFIFLSPDSEQIRIELEKRQCLDRCIIDYSGNFLEIEHYYRKAQYGFILRDDNVVNEVACPTKMQEYLRYGIVPVVLNNCVGDFFNMGCKFLTIDKSQLEINLTDNCSMIGENNYHILSKMEVEFEINSRKLHSLVMSLLNIESIKFDQLPIVNYNNRHFAQVYLDHGHGYSEKVSIKQRIINKIVQCKFEIIPQWQDKIINIRFDPLNTACEINIDKVLFYSVGSILEFTSYQIFKKSNFDMQSEDPWLVLNIAETVQLEKIIAVEFQYQICSKKKSLDNPEKKTFSKILRSLFKKSF